MKAVRLSRDANTDLLEIWTYIAGENEAAAARMVRKLARMIDLLSDHPEMGRVRYEYNSKYRSIAVRPYVIFYRIYPDYLEITRILHGARDIAAIFD